MEDLQQDRMQHPGLWRDARGRGVTDANMMQYLGVIEQRHVFDHGPAGVEATGGV